jgi:nesprin-1
MFVLLFQNFQKTLHEKLHSLEHLNKQYRRLAREGRTDTNGNLKHQIQDVNKRWDELSKQCQSVLRRLRHLINVRDDFTATREALLVWLSEVNSRITQLEHFSDSNTAQKMKGLEVNTNFNYLSFSLGIF